MGGGGGTKSKSSSQSGSGQLWAKPYAQAGASQVQGVFNQNQPGLQGLTNMAQNDLVPALYSKLQSGLPTAQQGNRHYSDILSGKFMNGNPHLQGMLDMTNRDINSQVNSRMANSGRYGSGVHDDVLARAIADNETNMRYQNYGDEMTRMDQAAQAAQGGTAVDSSQLMAGMGLGAELPYTGSNNFANSLGALFSGGTEQSSSKTKGPGMLGSLLGGAAQIGAAYLSKCDIRLKENIVLNHVDPDGLAFYDFDYKPGLGLPEGRITSLPMAQDVAKLRPWALGPEDDGYMTIYPGKL